MNKCIKMVQNKISISIFIYLYFLVNINKIQSLRFLSLVFSSVFSTIFKEIFALFSPTKFHLFIFLCFLPHLFLQYGCQKRSLGIILDPEIIQVNFLFEEKVKSFLQSVI